MRDISLCWFNTEVLSCFGDLPMTATLQGLLLLVSRWFFSRIPCGTLDKIIYSGFTLKSWFPFPQNSIQLPPQQVWLNLPCFFFGSPPFANKVLWVGPLAETASLNAGGSVCLHPPSHPSQGPKKFPEFRQRIGLQNEPGRRIDSFSISDPCQLCKYFFPSLYCPAPWVVR